MSKARIAIIGDSSSYQRSVREAAVVTNTLSVDMKKLAVSAESSAALQVKASVAKTARLRSEITAYREIAAAAKLGSREQIAAADLAARRQGQLAKLTPQAVLSPGRFGTSAARAQVLTTIKETEALRNEAAAYGRVAEFAKQGSQEQIIALERVAEARRRLGKIGPQAVLSPGGAARVQVLETVRQTEALRAEALAYREVAGAARHGSQEQVAAAQLAARAEGRLASSLGVTAHEARALSASSARVERDLGAATRGALAGSGVFRSLGRSIVYAGGGFLAFTSAAALVRKSIDVARAAAVTQRQLGAQFKASGLSLGVYQGQIDKTNLRLSALDAITKDQLDQSFTTIFRGTNNVGKALKDEAVAADIAAGRHIALSAASIAVGKAAAGSTTSLKRLGIELPKGTTGVEAIAIAAAKFKGQAAAASTEQQKFGAVLHDSEVIIGAGLLPTLNHYLSSGAKWLIQMNESGRLQRDVQHVTADVTRALHDAGAVAKFLVGGFRDLNKVTGSTENTLKSFASVWLLLKARTALIRWGIIESGIEGVGTRSLIASGEVGVLGRSLLKLRSLGPFVIPIALSFIPPNKKGQEALDRAGLGFLGHLPIIGGAEQQVAEAGQRTHDFLFGPPKPPRVRAQPLGGFNPATRGFVQSTPSNVSGELRFGDPTTAARTTLHETFAAAKLLNPTLTKKAFDLGQKVAQAFIDGIGKPPAAQKKIEVAKGLNLTGRFNVAELKLAQAQLTKTSADDIRILNTEASIVRQQIAGTKNLKDKTALTQKLVGIMGQLASASKQASDSFTLPGRLSLAAAKASATVTQADDLAAARETRAFVAKLIASGKLRGQALEQAYGQLASVNDQLRAAEKDAAAKAQASRDKARAVLQGRQFRALGLDATGSPLTPGVRGLKRELGSIGDVIKGTFLDTSKTRSLLGNIRKLLSGQLGILTKETRAKIKELLDGVRQEFDQHAGDNRTKFHTINTDKFLDSLGLNLTPAQRRAARGRLTQLGAGGVAPRPGGAFGATSTTAHFTVHTSVNLDGREVAKSTTKHQQTLKKQKSGPRRGRNAGHR